MTARASSISTMTTHEGPVANPVERNAAERHADQQENQRIGEEGDEVPQRQRELPPARRKSGRARPARGSRDCPSAVRPRRWPARPNRGSVRPAGTSRRPSTVVSVLSTRWSAVRPATAMAAPAQASPTTVPPPTVSSRSCITSAGVAIPPMVACAQASDQGKQHRRDAVVEQALAFDQQAQPAGDAVVLEHGDDGDRIGRGDQHAEQHGGAERPAQRRRPCPPTPRRPRSACRGSPASAPAARRAAIPSSGC